jgi:hypothetical protein
MKTDNLIKQSAGNGKFLIGIIGATAAEVKGFIYFLYNQGIIDLPSVETPFGGISSAELDDDTEHLANHYGDPEHFQYLTLSAERYITKRANLLADELLEKAVRENRENYGKRVHDFINKHIQPNLMETARKLAADELKSIPTKTFYRSGVIFNPFETSEKPAIEDCPNDLAALADDDSDAPFGFA